MIIFYNSQYNDSQTHVYYDDNNMLLPGFVPIISEGYEAISANDSLHLNGTSNKISFRHSKYIAWSGSATAGDTITLNFGGSDQEYLTYYSFNGVSFYNSTNSSSMYSPIRRTSTNVRAGGVTTTSSGNMLFCGLIGTSTDTTITISKTVTFNITNGSTATTATDLTISEVWLFR